MPVNCDQALAGYVQSAPDEAANIDTQVAQIEDVQAELEEKSQAIRECVTDKAEEDLLDYLDTTKLPELELTYPEIPGVRGPVYLVTYGGFGTIGYGTGNITEWEFRQDNLEIIPPATEPDPEYWVRYSYTPGDIPDIDGWVADYDFGNDYITHPVGIGAAYGLEPLVDMYEQGKATLLGNKAKIEQSIDVFKKYLS